MSSNKRGIYLESSSYNKILRNNVTKGNIGLYLKESSKNNISNNEIKGNDIGIHLEHSSKNNISKNRLKVESESESKGIYLEYSSNNIISNNNVTESGIGLYLKESSKNSISNNEIKGNDIGIFIRSSSDNEFSGNTLDNKMQVKDEDSTSLGDIKEPEVELSINSPRISDRPASGEPEYEATITLKDLTGKTMSYVNISTNGAFIFDGTSTSVQYSGGNITLNPRIYGNGSIMWNLTKSGINLNGNNLTLKFRIREPKRGNSDVTLEAGVKQNGYMMRFIYTYRFRSKGLNLELDHSIPYLITPKLTQGCNSIRLKDKVYYMKWGNTFILIQDALIPSYVDRTFVASCLSARGREITYFKGEGKVQVLGGVGTFVLIFAALTAFLLIRRRRGVEKRYIEEVEHPPIEEAPEIPEHVDLG